MRIELERLTGEGESFAHTYAPGELALSDAPADAGQGGDEQPRLAGEAVVAGRARRKGDEVSVSGMIRGGVEAPCDRCLRAVSLPLEVEFDVSYLPRGAEAKSGEESELQSEDLVTSVYEGEHLDVDELVREQLLLALPTSVRCGEDCKGLCPTCGADLNAAACSCEHAETDPRWAALADWKNQG